MEIFGVNLSATALQLFRLLLLRLSDVPYTFDATTAPLPSYDFIVVGSGAGGSIVAGRLAEVGARVLVLEAGPSAPPETSVPGLNGLLAPGLDWNIKSIPQTHIQLGYDNNSTMVRNGFVVGGGTTMNFMWYHRGNSLDYDNWAALGNDGWDFKSVLPYFKKTENFTGVGTSTTKSFHGRTGPMQVVDQQTKTPVQDAFLSAGRHLGYATPLDNNAGYDNTGFADPQVMIRDGVRETTSEAYLRPHVEGKYLDVRVEAMVTKILFNRHKRTTGVEFTMNGKKHTVRATKEVIVSAGSYNSPKLLLLSGVGPADHLAEHKIPVVADVYGVGRSLNEHPVISTLNWKVNKGSAMFFPSFFSPASFSEYLLNHTGPLSSPFGIEGSATVNLLGVDRPDWPDLQITAVSTSEGFAGASSNSNFFNVRDDIFAEFFPQPLESLESMTLVVMLLRPMSRGRVFLKSADPLDHPAIDPNYFGHPDDLRLTIKALKFCFKIANSPSMKRIGAQLIAKPMSRCRQHTTYSDGYWRCYAHHMIRGFHNTGTCKMAHHSDPLGVVSSRLKVRGVEGLRVVDGSIMPRITSGNIVAPILMIGEKAADMIKEDWRYPVYKP